MFGFQGGETARTVSRKKDYMKDAQLKWRFLTNLDCASVRTPGQLALLVKTRSGVAEEQARHDVDDWMVGKQF